jgi:hypothetical protein
MRKVNLHFSCEERGRGVNDVMRAQSMVEVRAKRVVILHDGVKLKTRLEEMKVSLPVLTCLVDVKSGLD